MSKSKSYRSLGRRYRTPEAAKYIGIAPSTLEKMRGTGDGPEFERVGKRAVVYSEEALEAYLAKRRARSTSEADVGAGPGRPRKNCPDRAGSPNSTAREKRKPDTREPPGSANDTSKPLDGREADDRNPGLPDDQEGQ
jgi:hypothetical protein